MIFVAAGLLLVIPSIETDIIGIVLMVLCVGLQLIRKPKNSAKKKTA